MSESREPLDDFEEIRRLVSAETDEALRRFWAGSFETDLRARIAAADRAAGEAPKRFLRLRPLAVPAVAVALILLLAIGAILIFRHGRQAGSNNAGMFVKAVGMLPGLGNVAAGPVGAPSGQRPTPASAGPVATVLGQAYKEKKAEEGRTAPATSPVAPHFS